MSSTTAHIPIAVSGGSGGEPPGYVRFRVAEYQQIIEAGILPEDGSFELLDGLIMHKDRSSPGESPMGHSPLHRKAVRLLIKLAARIDSAQRHLQIQLPIAIPDYDAPEPDAAVILGSDDRYTDRLPGPGDVVSVIEVAHSSLIRDETTKLHIYAAAGIPQYIIVNLQTAAVEVFTGPEPRGYRTHITLRREDTLLIELGRGESLGLPVRDLLP